MKDPVYICVYIYMYNYVYKRYFRTPYAKKLKKKYINNIPDNDKEPQQFNTNDPIETRGKIRKMTKRTYQHKYQSTTSEVISIFTKNIRAM